MGGGQKATVLEPSAGEVHRTGIVVEPATKTHQAPFRSGIVGNGGGKMPRLWRWRRREAGVGGDHFAQHLINLFQAGAGDGDVGAPVIGFLGEPQKTSHFILFQFEHEELALHLDKHLFQQDLRQARLAEGVRRRIMHGGRRRLIAIRRGMVA